MLTYTRRSASTFIIVAHSRSRLSVGLAPALVSHNYSSHHQGTEARTER
jgi:hypothetical protein